MTAIVDGTTSPSFLKTAVVALKSSMYLEHTAVCMCVQHNRARLRFCISGSAVCVAGLKRANSLGCRERLNAAFVRNVWGTERKVKKAIFL